MLLYISHHLYEKDDSPSSSSSPSQNSSHGDDLLQEATQKSSNLGDIPTSVQPTGQLSAVSPMSGNSEHELLQGLREQNYGSLGAHNDQRINNFITHDLWKRVKFVVNDIQLSDTGKNSMFVFCTTGLHIADNKRHDFWNRHKKHFKSKLRVKRNNVTQSMKQRFMSTYAPSFHSSEIVTNIDELIEEAMAKHLEKHPCEKADKSDFQPEYDLKSIIKALYLPSTRTMKAYFWAIEVFMPPIASIEDWKANHTTKKVSEFLDETGENHHIAHDQSCIDISPILCAGR